MRKHWLVLGEDDFGRSITLSRSTDQYSCEAEADAEATDSVKGSDGEAMYLYELKRVYTTRPKEPTKEVEVVYVD